MDRLWSPWRMEYIQSAAETSACFLCDHQAFEDETTALILARTELAFVILNAYPYNPGHLMVAPCRHVGDVEDVDESEMADVSRLLQRSVRALRVGMAPQGFNLGMNLDRVAGAGVPDHLHWHVVPRWAGDTNFMPIVGETRVLPELLAETYAKLRPHFGGDDP